MHRITLIKGNSKFTIDIGTTKFIIGDNEKTKFDIYQLLKSAFAKTPNSDYAIESGSKHSSLFDDRPFDTKIWKFYEVTPFFDIDNDLKMGTKSLTMRYLESFADSLEQNETYTTLSILTKSLNEDFFNNEPTLLFGDKELKFAFGGIPRSAIFKECSPLLISNALDMNTVDLSYDDIIDLQINMISSIACKETDKMHLVYCNAPSLTSSTLINLINKTINNVFMVIVTNDLPKCDVKDLIICSKHYIDFANEDMLLDLLMDLPFHIQKSELIDAISIMLSMEKIDKDNHIAIELFPWKL